MATAEPMSDRRTIVLVVAVVAAAVGVVVTVVAAVALQDPFTAAIVVGILLVVGGIGVATGLVRAQLHGPRR